ncbi:MAG: glycosyltransferase [Chloroflexi bacterium]|nr:glycosyltransferase [Chloroflexota bacterium]
MTIQVSVVIPTYNRVADLQDCLAALEQQTLPLDQFEVIVVDDGSPDHTADYLKQKATDTPLNLRPITQRNQGPAAARNTGIEAAQGDLIVFTDDDCVPAPDWLHNLVVALPPDERCAGVGGLITRYKDSLIGRYIDEKTLMLPLMERGQLLFLVTANALYRKRCLQEVNGFQVGFAWPGGEDADISYRARQRGYYFILTPLAVIRHKHRDTLAGVTKTFRYYGQGDCAQEALTEGYQRISGGLRGWLAVLFGMVTAIRYLARRSLSFRERLGFIWLDWLRFINYQRGYNYCKRHIAAGLRKSRETSP